MSSSSLSINLAEASKELPDHASLLKVALIQDKWLDECFARPTPMPDFNQKRFWVSGMSSAYLTAVPDAGDAVMKGTNPQVNRRDSSGSVAAMASETELIDEHAAQPEGTERAADDEADDATARAPRPDNLSSALEMIREVGTVSFEQYLEESPPSSQTEPAGKSELEVNLADMKFSAFMCMQKNDGVNLNPNLRTMAYLEQMGNHYEQKDHFRSRAYRLAVSALRKHKELISTESEAVAIAHIGPSIAKKIEEIVRTGKFQKLEMLQGDPEEQILALFMGVYGAGLKQAQAWKNRGLRTLDDLTGSADLTANQRIGIEHYEDFATRIPREEVSKHADIVRKALLEADPELQMTVGGSYRRGNRRLRGYRYFGNEARSWARAYSHPYAR